jgi:hypothetical protein
VPITSRCGTKASPCAARAFFQPVQKSIDVKHYLDVLRQKQAGCLEVGVLARYERQ